VSRPVSIVWNIRRYGIREGSRWLYRAASYHAWLHLTPAGHKELDFDRLHQSDTDGYSSKEELGLPTDSIHYAPVRPRRFELVIRKLPIQPSDFTFIDLGCGKGRALILAEDLGFKSIIGVEYSCSLSLSAKMNCPATEIYNMDAIDYRFPLKPSVVFLYNPFWSPTIDAVAANLNQSLSEHPRELWTVYLNPFCEAVFLRQSNLRLVSRAANDYAIFRNSK
jgi:SAM-dependent methyltransferase